MLVVSTTLTGNSEAVIGDALRSVIEWVDLCLVIDTGVTDQTLRIAREVAGPKYRERRFPWRQDFSAARNFALDAATELGANWAITVDTDERIELNGEDLRSLLGSTTSGVLMLSDTDRSYCKERCFRLPCSVRFSGPTHESFPGYSLSPFTAPRATFAELPKSAEQLERKFRRDLAILRGHTAAHPNDPRWLFYLGETYKNLKELEPAVKAYSACAALRSWDEEAAWACYRAAECLIDLGRHQEALDRCALGLTHHAGIAELAWLAGFCAYTLGRHVQCVHWARLAITHGLFRGDGANIPRIGFRHPPGLWEGPYDLLRFALGSLGDGSGAAEAEALYHQALAARTGKHA
jgi:tetratricopeptide (TPR) repeat protein